MYQADYYVCGLAPFGTDMVTVAYVEEEEDQADGNGPLAVAQRPELRISTLRNEEVCSDALSIRLVHARFRAQLIRELFCVS